MTATMPPSPPHGQPESTAPPQAATPPPQTPPPQATAPQPRPAPPRQQSAPPTPRREPRWLAPVRIAVWVMAVLIVIGLGLLGYGLATQSYDLFTREAEPVAETPQLPPPPAVLTFTHPNNMRFYQIATAADGKTVIVLRGEDGRFEAITLDAHGREVQRIMIAPAPPPAQE